MARVFGIIFLILSILLFPPAALALISNNAVPGDTTYPIKRKLEDGILLIASFHPTTKAWFSVERSNRRFVEATALLGQGKAATETIDELVFQTEAAVDEVVKVNDNAQKDQLISQLSESIDKYDKGLAKASGAVIEETAPLTPPPPVESTPVPTLTPIPQPTAGSAPAQTGPSEKQKQELEEARKKLEEIKKRLEEERKRLEEGRRKEREQRQQQEKKVEEPKQTENKQQEVIIEQLKQENAGKKDE